MLRLDRYIIREWLRNFVGTLVVLLSLMVIFDMYDGFKELLAVGVTPGQGLRYYALLLPSFLPVVVPLSLMVSLTFSLTNLHRNNEVMAMRAAGWSLWRVSRWLWVAALLLSAGLFVLNARVAPWSQEAAESYFRELAETAGDPRNRTLVETLGFEDRATGTLWFMNRMDSADLHGYGVTVHDRDAPGPEHTRILAREARFLPEAGYWSFADGRVLELDTERGLPLRSLTFERLDRPDLTAHPRLMLALDEKPNDLSLFQLRDLLATIDAEHPMRPAYAVRYQKMLAGPLVCFFLVGIAVPLAVSGVRTTAMSNIARIAGLFVLYFVLTSLSTLLGEREILPVTLSAWLPQGLMLLAALWLFTRSR